MQRNNLKRPSHVTAMFMLAALGLVSLTASLSAQPVEYTFTKIVEAGDLSSDGVQILGLEGSGIAVINNNGEVAFSGSVPNFQVGVFLGDGEPPSLLALNRTCLREPIIGCGASQSDQLTQTLRIFGIDNFGGVLLTATFGPSSGDGTSTLGAAIVRGAGGPLEVMVGIDRAAGPEPFSSFGAPTASADGNIVFHAFLTSGQGGIFKGPNLVTDTIALVGATYDQLSAVPLPGINNSGVAVFEARVGATVDFFVSDGGAPTSILNTAFFSRDEAVINDADVVAVAYSPLGGQEVIVTGSGGPLTTIADTSGAYSALDDLTINNDGTVVFYAMLDGGGGAYGIYTGADPEADKVIAVGDTLDGGTVSVLWLDSPQGMNDSGQIAFTARLDDGREGIFRADPLDAPPGTASELIQDLIMTIESFNLQQGISNSLDKKLENAAEALDAANSGQREDAINKLEAFVNAVDAQRPPGGVLTDEQADELLTRAAAIIDLL